MSVERLSVKYGTLPVPAAGENDSKHLLWYILQCGGDIVRVRLIPNVGSNPICPTIDIDDSSEILFRTPKPVRRHKNYIFFENKLKINETFCKKSSKTTKERIKSRYILQQKN